MHTLLINRSRFLADFSELSQIGATAEGGVNRPSFSDAHLQARAWFRQKALRAGLSFHIDPAGNHSALLTSTHPAAQTLLLGSHLDSVYNGGRYDGALGVLAALEVLRTIKDAGLQPSYHLEAVDFSDEEGTLVGMLGSKAFTGKCEPGMLEQSIAGKDAVEAALHKAGLTADLLSSAQRDPQSLAGYLELHIEQGARLHRAGVKVGVVSGIVGMGVLRVTFRGKANHAGTTFMHERQDAGLGACGLTLAAHALAIEQFPDSTVTVGQMSFSPGGVNIVPAEAVLSIDFRSAHPGRLAQLESALCRLASEQAARFLLSVDVEKTLEHAPAVMDSSFQGMILEASEGLKLSTMVIPSGAGHDAQNMAAVCPCGMIFVPSIDGVSHSPAEKTSDEDCVNGANVLLHSTLRIAR